ncbi:MAG: triple tyrosine motif-containing protein [Acidobacteria bacterium]|nr:triple tyrosine motif-containing protein [Acidobacteriota bacterium]
MLGCVTNLSAQTPTHLISQFSHENWQAADGLPQNSIQAVVQTRDGYLWIGTQEGLVRFDGVRFTVYGSRNTPQFRSNHVEALLEARDGTLWLGTYGGGLISMKDGQFRLFRTTDGLSSDSVMDLAEDFDGAIWIATEGGGVSRWSAKSGFTTFTTADGLGSRSTTSVIADVRGVVWVGTAVGVSRFDNGKFVTYTSRNGVAGDSVTALAGDRQGNIWIGTTQGLTRWREGKAATYTVRRGGLPNDVVRTLHVDDAAVVWVGTRGGLARLEKGAVSTLTSRDGLANDDVTAIMQDREGSYWIGTNGGGLDRWRDASFTTYGPQLGPSDDVYAVTGSRDGGLWAGSGNGRVYHFKDGRFTPLDTRGHLAGTIVRALLEDRQGNLWIGTERQLYRYRQGVFEVYDQSRGLPGFSVRVVFEDRDGRIWVGTNGGGLSYIDGDRLVTYTTRDGLAENRVRAMVQDKDGSLWIGSYGGLNHFKDGVFHTYTVSQGLSNNFARSLHFDDDGTLWIATYGGGLNRFKNGRITAYGTRDGFFSDTSFQIVDDQLGNLWLSCNTGIFRVSKQALEAFSDGRATSIASTTYTEADGMKSRECNGGSPGGWRTDDGRLWFATLKGLASVDPANLRRNPKPPPVLVEDVIVDGRPIEPGDHIQAGSQRFEFRFTGLSFVAPARMRFVYRLEGFDRKWIDAGAQRSASYTSIPYGSHRFLVKAANDDGVWSGTPASFDFVLEPHFYQTFLFYGCAALTLVASCVGLYRLRTGQLRKRQRVLQAKVDEAVAHIKTLRGLLPICASCKRVRDDGGYWNQIEQYVRDHSEAAFSHGICPDCIRKLYPEHADLADEHTPGGNATGRSDAAPK